MNIYLKLTTVRLLPNQTTSQKKQSQLTELSKFLEHKRADIHQNITWFLDNKNHNEITTLVNQIKNIFKCTKFQHVLNKLSNYFNHKTGGDKVNTSACINLLSEILKTNIANAEQITAGNKTIGGTNGTSAENVGNRFQLRTEYKSTNPSAFGDGGTLVDAVACRHIKPVQLALIQSGGGGSVAGAEIQKDLEHVTPTPTASGGGGTVAGAATPDVGSLETGPKTSIIPPDEEPTIFNILNHLITMFEESNHHPINLNKYLSQIDGSLHNKTLNLIQGLLVKLDEDSSDVSFEKFREFIQENKIKFLEDAIKSLITSKPQKIKKKNSKTPMF